MKFGSGLLMGIRERTLTINVVRIKMTELM